MSVEPVSKSKYLTYWQWQWSAILWKRKFCCPWRERKFFVVVSICSICRFVYRRNNKENNQYEMRLHIDADSKYFIDISLLQIRRKSRENSNKKFLSFRQIEYAVNDDYRLAIFVCDATWLMCLLIMSWLCIKTNLHWTQFK